MTRLAYILCAALALGVALIAYGVKQETAERERELTELSARAAQLRERIATLEAEWAHLNSPAYLRSLMARIYGEKGAEGGALRPLRPDQVMAIDELPNHPDLVEQDVPEGAPAPSSKPGEDQ